MCKLSLIGEAVGSKSRPLVWRWSAKLAPNLPEQVCTEIDRDRERETDRDRGTEGQRQAGDGSPPNPGLGGLPCSPFKLKLVRRGSWKRSLFEKGLQDEMLHWLFWRN